MPGYHPEWQPGYKFEDEEGSAKQGPAAQQAEAVSKQEPPRQISTTSIGEKGVAQVGESDDCEDGGILRI